MQAAEYRSVFSSCGAQERQQNFESYWKFTQQHAGELFEADKDVGKKRERLKYFQDNPIRSRKPLLDPDAFYRNFVNLRDDPKTLDRKTLLLCCIDKFARHEWVGISGAWDVIPAMAECKLLTDKISRVHVAEEFCHVRLFDEMLRTFHLDRVEWVPLGPIMSKIYRIFPVLPGFLMDGPAFITELMGMNFYQHLDRVLDDVFDDEPEARDRLHELLREIMVDEMAHVGQRRNFVGAIGVRVSKWLIRPLYTLFFHDIPESKYLFDVEQLIQDGKNFDYSSVPAELFEQSWIPTYCGPVQQAS